MPPIPSLSMKSMPGSIKQGDVERHYRPLVFLADIFPELLNITHQQIADGLATPVVKDPPEQVGTAQVAQQVVAYQVARIDPPAMVEVLIEPVGFFLIDQIRCSSLYLIPSPLYLRFN
jgi:hypothetical protein